MSEPNTERRPWDPLPESGHHHRLLDQKHQDPSLSRTATNYIAPNALPNALISMAKVHATLWHCNLNLSPFFLPLYLCASA